MKYYQCYNYIIKSDLELSQLEETDSEFKYDVKVVIGKVDESIHRYISKGCNYGFAEQAFWFANDFAIFMIESGELISIEIIGEKREDILAQFIIGYCMSIIGYQLDKMSFHASVLSIDNKGLLIAGGSGSGKTSLSLALIYRGYKLVSDDLALMNKNGVVLPGHSYQNVCVDHIEKYNFNSQELLLVDSDRMKYSINMSSNHKSIQQTSKAMIVIEVYEGKKISLKKVHRKKKFDIIMNQLYLIHFFDGMVMSTEKENEVRHIADLIDLYILRRPMNIDTTEQQAQKVESLMNKL